MDKFHLPEYGKLLFDYVSGRRVNPGLPPLEEERFDAVMSSIYQSECSEEAKIDSFRAFAHKLNLKAVQLRQFISIFEDMEMRREVFVELIFRVIDIWNEKIARVKFGSQEEYSKILQRLGHATMFPFIQPEQHEFSYDMRFNDQRLAALCVWKLCNNELTANLKDAKYTMLPDADKADEVVFWRAAKTENLDTCPRHGIFSGKYFGAPETRDYALRRRMLETYGWWPGCPTNDSKVEWWSSIWGCPPDIVEFVEFLVPRYPKLKEVFYVIDGSYQDHSVANGEITLKEFECGLVAMGCKKFAGENEKKRIYDIFKFLDPTGEGVVTEGEWSILESLWREIDLCILEFVRFLKRTFAGGLAEWWRELDTDGSGEITMEEFDAICDEKRFFGAREQVFRFLDKDDLGSMGVSEFKTLESYIDRELPT